MAGLDHEALEEIGESIERFARESYPFERFQALGRTEERFGLDEWRQYGELGWLSLPISEADGGLEGGPIAFVTLMKSAGSHLLREPFIATLALGVTLLTEVGTDAQRAAILPEIAGGNAILALADREPGDAHGSTMSATIAVSTGSDYRLTGRKCLVLAGPVATHLIVSALDDAAKALALFLVPAEAPGLLWTRYPMLDGRIAGDLALHDVAVPAEARLSGGDVAAALTAARALALLGISAEATGSMARLISITAEYLKTRKQFGVPLASFQVLKHRLVDMLVAQYEAAALVRTTAEAMAAGDGETPRLIAALKARSSRAARVVGEGAIQLHGGMGMTDELPVGHYFKRLLTLASLFGDVDWHLRVLDMLGAGTD